jgi:lipid II:glycine glycyltransferase (peptidoglycan interpeptide bridge formation enzyme)
MRPLARGYTAEFDRLDREQWDDLVLRFDDANIYQTWAYGDVVTGSRHSRHLALKREGEVVALALARVVKVPLLRFGIAYIRWGPLWRRDSDEDGIETFRQAIRALRNEYAVKAGLVVRLLPMLFRDSSELFADVLADEGFRPSKNDGRTRTIVMDLGPSLEELRIGMKAHWKRELKIAEKNRLEVVEGVEDGLFATTIDIHREMVARKKFVEGNDINHFRSIQARLPDGLKMRIMICRSEGVVVSALVASAMGKTALYLFGATSNAGMKSRGSYLLQWKLLEWLKSRGVSRYDLNGINPEKNPGTYKFKSDLGGDYGRDVAFLGRFDTHANELSHRFVAIAETVRRGCQKLADHARVAREWKL